MLLKVEELFIEFVTPSGRVPAVNGVSFEVEPGKTLGIVGESGCGKSVTAMSLMRLLPSKITRVRAKAIEFAGSNLLSLGDEGMRSLRGDKIAMIFQDPMTSLNPVFKIGFQVAEVLFIHRPSLSSDEVKKRTLSLLKMVGIGDGERRYNDYPHQLSGGMRQRVMIAMALACEPSLLIADEPTTALDVTIQAQILELIQDLQRKMGMSVLLITHDLGVIAEMADDVAVMYAGKIVEKASVTRLFDEPLHPYTQGLLDTVPSRGAAEGGRGRLNAIPGMVPDLMHLPTGCAFQDRCQFAVPHCQAELPALVAKRASHLVSCFEVKDLHATS